MALNDYEQEIRRSIEQLKRASLGLAFFNSGGGIRTPDLRVMSPTSYQAALPRDKFANIRANRRMLCIVRSE